MQDPNPINPADRELEEALGALRPSASSISREELLFRAGQRSMAGRLWAWRGATVAVAALAAIALGLFMRPTAAPSPQIVYRDRIVEHRELVPVAPPAAAAAEEPHPRIDAREFRLRQRIIQFGADAMPSQVSAVPASISIDRLIGIPSSELGVGELLLRPSTHQRGGL